MNLAGKSQYNAIFQIADCPFRNERCNMSMTSVTGHMMEIDFDAQYRSWNGIRPIDLFDAPITKAVKKESENIASTLSDLSKRKFAKEHFK